MSTVTMMKKDAVINLKVGTGFLLQMHKVLVALASQHTKEELDEFRKLAEAGEKNLPEEWMEHLFTLSVFIRNMEDEAVKQGATYQQNIDDINKQGS